MNFIKKIQYPRKKKWWCWYYCWCLFVRPNALHWIYNHRLTTSHENSFSFLTNRYAFSEPKMLSLPHHIISLHYHFPFTTWKTFLSELLLSPTLFPLLFSQKNSEKESKTSKSWNRVWRKLLRKDTQSNFSNRLSLSSSSPKLFSQFLWSSNIKEKYMGLVWCAINKLEQVSYEMFCRKSIENASKEK